MAIRVIAAEDHPLMLKAIKEELSSDPEIQVVGDLNHSSDLAKYVRERKPDVLLLDLSFAGEAFEPITTVKDLKQNNPNLKILILTGYDDPILMHSLVQAGALGYILKSEDLSMALPRAVKAVNKGDPFYSDKVVHKLITIKNGQILNDQEMATLRLLANGLTNNEIAISMKLSEKRIRNVLTIIYSKLDVSGDRSVNQRVACINKARELGLLNDK